MSLFLVSLNTNNDMNIHVYICTKYHSLLLMSDSVDTRLKCLDFVWQEDGHWHLALIKYVKYQILYSWF